MKLQGSATAEGTERYRKRFEGKIPSGHFRQSQGLWLSSIGIGTGWPLKRIFKLPDRGKDRNRIQPKIR